MLTPSMFGVVVPFSSFEWGFSFLLWVVLRASPMEDALHRPKGTPMSLLV